VGGIFARPCESWGLGDTCPALLKKFPYLLPCALGSLVSIFASVMSAYFLEETLQRVKTVRRKLRQAGYETVGEVEMEGSSRVLLQGDLAEGSSRGQKLAPEVIHMGPEHSRHGGSINGGTAFAQLMQMRAQSITAKASRAPSVTSKGAQQPVKQQNPFRDPPYGAESPGPSKAETRRNSRVVSELLDSSQSAPGASMHGAATEGVKRRAELAKGDADGSIAYSSGSVHGAAAYSGMSRRISGGDRRQSGEPTSAAAIRGTLNVSRLTSFSAFILQFWFDVRWVPMVCKW
jgi:hypothetical protein